MTARRARRPAEIERGLRIQAARMARPLTLEALAKLVSVSFQLIDQWERGYGEPKGYQLTELAVHLGVSETFITHGHVNVKKQLDQIVAAREAERIELSAARQAERERRAAEARQVRIAAAEAAMQDLARLQKIEDETICCRCRKRRGLLTGSKFFCDPCWRNPE